MIRVHVCNLEWCTTKTVVELPYSVINYRIHSFRVILTGTACESASSDLLGTEHKSVSSESHEIEDVALLLSFGNKLLPLTNYNACIAYSLQELTLVTRSFRVIQGCR